MSLKTAVEQPTRRQWMHPWSLAGRLAVSYGTSAFLLLLLGTGFQYWALAEHLRDEDDLRLENKVAELDALLRVTPMDLISLRRALDLEYVARSLEPVLVRIKGADGK